MHPILIPGYSRHQKEFQWARGAFEAGKINSLFERFRKRTGILSEGKKRIYRVPVWKGDLYNRGKILFAGDSAGQVLPLTYEGIYYAMKAGELAAMAIIEGNVNNYKKMWKDRFQKRFTLMDKLRNYFLKDDASAEKLVAYHRRPEIQEASLHLWLRKDGGKAKPHELFAAFPENLALNLKKVLCLFPRSSRLDYCRDCCLSFPLRKKRRREENFLRTLFLRKNFFPESL